MTTPTLRRNRAGFTLMELMVTMGIMAMLLGLGTGIFTSMGRRSAQQLAMQNVNALVTKARNSSNRYPAVIAVDPANGMVHAYAEGVLQELHFESRPVEAGDPVVPMGIDGRTCSISAGEVDPKGGRVGGAARLRGGSIDCSNYAAYNVDQGIGVEVWFKLQAVASFDIVSRGSSFRAQYRTMSRGAGARIDGQVGVRSKNGSEEKLPIQVEVPPARIGEWYGVRISCDRREMIVATDEGRGFVQRSRLAFEKPEEQERVLAFSEDAPLLICAGMNGWVDDVRVGGIRSTDPVKLPEGIEVLPSRPIRFVDGRLDPVLHTGKESIFLRLTGEDRAYALDYGPNGALLEVRDTADGTLRIEEAVRPASGPPPARKE
ncbi:MAG: hypothetical protein HMLKMBBP_01349 [Planctomycetes bacterium]|nr:hypothetical protein [Planctomycetota bacterium]